MTFSLEWLRHRLREMLSDHSRSLLVILGILWGTMSLTVVLSFGQGFHAAMLQAVRASGHHLIRIWSGMTTEPFAGLPAGRWMNLPPEDGPLLARQVFGVRAVSVEFKSSGDPLEYEGRQTNVRTHGVNACYGELRSLWPAAGGRFLNEPDIHERRRVIFLGHQVKERLFGAQPALGATVKLWGIPFQVVGTMRPKTTMSNYEGMDPEKVFIPSTTYQALRGRRYVNYLLLGLHSPDQEQPAIRDIYQALGTRHRFHPQDTRAIGLHSHIEDDRRTLAIVDGIRILLGITGLLGLLVALIGVANVMYVLVEEQRREIGIQMALGAQPATLMSGFFLEGLVLTFTGGILGLVSSAVVLGLFNLLPLDPGTRGYLGQPVLSLTIAALVILLLGITGCAAGYFPARRAAALDPVVALREE